MRTTIDKAGRVVIPKPMRDALHLQPGDPLEISLDDHHRTLQLRPPPSRLVRKDGMWLLETGGPPITDEDLQRELDDARRERDDYVAGISHD